MDEFEKAKRRFQGADMENREYELPLDMELDKSDVFFQEKFDFVDNYILITR